MWPVVAVADESLNVTGTVGTGFTDNILSVPASDDPTDAQVEADLFMTLGPRVNAVYEARRAIHNLSYLFTANLFLRRSEGNSFNNAVAYAGLFHLTSRQTARANARFTTGRVNNFDRADGGVEPTDELPQGDVAFISGQAGVGHSYVWSPSVTTSEALGISAFQPTNTDNVGTTYVISSGLGVQKGFRYHLFGLNVAGAFNNNQRAGDALDQRSITLQPTAFWAWDISLKLNSRIFGGMAVAVETDAFERGVALPIAGLTLDHQVGRGRVTGTVARGVFANVFTSDVTVDNRVVIRGAMPVPGAEEFGVTATAGYRRGRFIDFTTETLQGVTQQFSAGAGVSYLISPAWSAAARYSLVRQRRNNPITGENRSIARRTILFTLSGRFPTREGFAIRDKGTRVDEQYEDLDPSLESSD